MRRVLIACLLLIVVAGASLLVLTRVAPSLVAARLAAIGFDEARIAEVEIGLTHASLDGIALADGQSIGRIDVDFRLSDLLRGRVAEIVIEGLDVAARFDEDGWSIPGLTPRTDGAGGGPPPVLPDRAVLRDARITVTAPPATVRVDLDAVIARDGERFAVEIDSAGITGEVGGGEYLAEISGHGRLWPFAEDPLATLDAELAVETSGAGLALGELARTGRVEAAADLVVADRVVRANALRLTGTIEQLAEPDLLARIGASLPLAVEVGAGGRTASAEVDLAGPAPVFAADLPLRLGAGAVDATIDLRGSAGSSADGGLERIAIERLRVDATGLRGDGIGTIEPLELSFEGAGSPATAQGSGRVHAGFEGAAEGPLRGRVAADLPFALALAPHDLTLDLTGGAALDLTGFGAAGLVETVDGRISLGGNDTPDLSLDRTSTAWTLQLPATTAGLKVAPDPVTGVPPLVVAQAGLTLAVEGKGTAVGRGTLRLRDGEIALDAPAIALSGLEATVPFAAGGLVPGTTVEIGIGTVRDRAEPHRFAPLAARVEIIPHPDRLAFTGDVRAVDRAVAMRFTGEHRPGPGEVRAEVVLDPVAFAPGRLQPRALVPALGTVVREVGGTVGLAGEVTWRGDRIASDLEVLLEDLALTAGPARIEGLAGVVAVDGLLPPSTRPAQRLAIGLLDIGLPLTDGTVLFGLPPGDPLDVRRLRFAWAGGRIEAEPFTVGSPGGVISIVLDASGLDLDAIFAQVKLPGLSGDGTIDGRLPLRIDGAAAVIEGGELTSRRPGWIRYRPESTPGAFAAGGESMALLMQALENFRYEDLRITLDGRTDAAMDIGLHLEGANPGLYDGHPVAFNLNLEGELANILRHGLRSYTLPGRVQERIEEYRNR